MQGIIESIDLVVNHGADPEDLIQTIYRGSGEWRKREGFGLRQLLILR